MEEMDEKDVHILDIQMEMLSKEIKRLGCTYPNELARNTLIPKERCVSIVYKLLKECLVFRLVLHPEKVPIEMIGRIKHFWSIGIHGYDMFSRITWVIPLPQIPMSRYGYDYKIIREDFGEPVKIEEDCIECA